MANSIMRSTDFRAVVEPILNESFDGLYDQRADEWKSVFTQSPGISRAYQEENMFYGFPAAPEMPDGMPVTYQAGGTLFTKRYWFKQYGLAFALTKVLVEDGEHVRIGQTYSKHLAQALAETKETLPANVLNRAFNGASEYVGGDGVSLISTAHPIIGGTYSNQLTTAASLSQTSLQQMLTQIRNAISNEGKRIRLTPRKIVTGPANMFQAEILLKSALTTGSGNNDINPINSMKLLPEDTAIISRLTSTTAWFILTDAKEGMKLLMRRPLEKSMEGDFETDSMRYKATERYAVGWTEPRAMYGTPGI